MLQQYLVRSLSRVIGARVDQAPPPIPEPPEGEGPRYPRIANPRIGTRSWGDRPGGTGVNAEKNPIEIANMAQGHFSVINGQPYRGQSFKDAMVDCITSIKAINPDHKVYQYDNFNETGNSLSGAEHDMLVAESGPPGQLIAGGSPVGDSWYARDGDGNLEETFPGTYAVNLTPYVVPNTDTAEDRYFGELYIDEVFPGDHVDGFSTVMDGWFIDVFDHRPRENSLNYSGLTGDDNARSNWNVAGRGYDVASAYRNGQARGATRIKTNYPGKHVLGNLTTWPQEYSGTDPTFPKNEDGNTGTYKEYKNLMHGAWMENQSNQVGAFGFCGAQADGTLHTFGTPRMAMNNYMYLMRHTLTPRHVMNQWTVLVSSIPTDRSPIVGTHITSAAMCLQRLATTQTLLDDGYCAVGIILSTKTDCFDQTAIWDEHGTANQGTTGLNREWLGLPLEDPLRIKEDNAGTAVPWIAAGDIYKREFENGLSISRWDKPGGSIGDAITGDYNIPVVAGGSLAAGQIPSGEYKLIAGVQDPAVNTGQVVNTTNFPSGLPIRRMDGRVLERV